MRWESMLSPTNTPLTTTRRPERTAIQPAPTATGDVATACGKSPLPAHVKLPNSTPYRRLVETSGAKRAAAAAVILITPSRRADTKKLAGSRATERTDPGTASSTRWSSRMRSTARQPADGPVVDIPQYRIPERPFRRPGVQRIPARLDTPRHAFDQRVVENIVIEVHARNRKFRRQSRRVYY